MSYVNRAVDEVARVSFLGLLFVGGLCLISGLLIAEAWDAIDKRRRRAA